MAVHFCKALVGQNLIIEYKAYLVQRNPTLSHGTNSTGEKNQMFVKFKYIYSSILMTIIIKHFLKGFRTPFLMISVLFSFCHKIKRYSSLFNVMVNHLDLVYCLPDPVSKYLYNYPSTRHCLIFGIQFFMAFSKIVSDFPSHQELLMFLDYLFIKTPKLFDA